MTSQEPIIIEPVIENVRQMNWYPVVGEETLCFLKDVVPDASREGVCNTAVSILAKGISPEVPKGKETGLVIGYVQSGKTMSFEAVVALARDNGFPMVIIIAGTANNLLTQSTDRLRRDLRINEPNSKRRWVVFKNPSCKSIPDIRNILEGRRERETSKQDKRTVLITILKHHRHLNNVTQILRAVKMRNIPVLIIDDEADQASLNTKIAQDEKSTTYQCLMSLRDALPVHTYLQYTATPQAPLLISIIDSLSPNFVQVLEQGKEYVGGREFFVDNSRLARVIPSREVLAKDNPLDEPPNTLLEALRVFMIGVTVGILKKEQTTSNRSMLIHPSHRIDQHQKFYDWVHNIFEEWKHVLDLSDGDPDKQETIKDFRDGYDELSYTVANEMPTFDELVPSLLCAFRYTQILKINASGGKTPEVEWNNSYGWVLVGGQAMDRGFTIKGLTVTYMPRGVGVGNADTIQQRARFFGYKRSYLGYCRVYLEQKTLNAFQNYVEHEEDIRGQLEKLQNSNRPLNEWKRAFILDGNLKPCRDSVLEFEYVRGCFSDEWVLLPNMVLASEEVIEATRQVSKDFMQALVFDDDEGHQERTDAQRHKVCRQVSLQIFFEKLLAQMRITGIRDSQRYTGLLLQLSKAIENNSSEVCTIYRISPAYERERSVNKHGEIITLFQGEAPVNPKEQRGKVYPGDRAIRENGTVTVQIHVLNLTRDRKIIKKDVHVVAVWIPARLGSVASWINQEQPDQVN